MRFFIRLVRAGEGFHVYNIKLLYLPNKVNKENQNNSGKLLEIQDINKLDAVSGATWSYNIFRASVKEALKR